jgi:hypothetical protein
VPTLDISAQGLCLLFLALCQPAFKVDPGSLISKILFNQLSESVFDLLSNELFRELSGLGDQEVAVRPKCVIGHLAILELLLDELKLPVPKVEALDEPELVALCMIVLGIAQVYLVEEILLLVKVTLVDL